MVAVKLSAAVAVTQAGNNGENLMFFSSPPDNMAAISDAFSWMKRFVFWLNFLWSLLLSVQLTITQHNIPDIWVSHSWSVCILLPKNSSESMVNIISVVI